ncbi:putative splicing factor 3B subunit 5 [Monocercomonoides exilis]|uniref:putative splicing factor 3B subunit 5 n=1 Tax=Monocercomonoides exilis TaxID=2049356 RepID=UPI003559D31F|nr:putative splicing factor 3B subunit 5 [Monocercomonoides exilis]
MSWISPQADHLQQKYTGTGHSDTSQYEWMTTIQRDSCASYIGHQHMLYMMAMARNESLGKIKYELLEKMFQPCGTPPKKDDDLLQK